MDFMDCCGCGFMGYHYIDDNGIIDYIEYFKIHMQAIEYELRDSRKRIDRQKIKNILYNYEMILRGEERVCICDCHKYQYITM